MSPGQEKLSEMEQHLTEFSDASTAIQKTKNFEFSNMSEMK